MKGGDVNDDNCSLSQSTLYRVLTEHQVEPLKCIKRIHKLKRYQKATPGERVEEVSTDFYPGKEAARVRSYSETKVR
jgi:hypothetical protein